MAKISKRMKKVYEGLDRNKIYPVDEAINILLERKSTKFDETVEISATLGIDTKKSDQIVRGMLTLPNGTGKSYKVAVFAKGDKAQDAVKAGADLVGDEDLAEKILKGELGFDRVIATPDLMTVVGKVSKILGPKGLMPNPKLGTVTLNIAEAVKSAKAGQIEYRADKQNMVNTGIGKVSMKDKKIKENLLALVDALKKAKPATSKGTYLKQVVLSTSMGAGLKLDTRDL